MFICTKIMLPTSCSQTKIDQGRNTLADHSQEIQDSSDERLWLNGSTKTLLMSKMLLPILSSFPSSLFHLGSNLHLWSYGSFSLLWLPLFFSPDTRKSHGPISSSPMSDWNPTSS